jgi:sensor histidine kinase YesM
MTAMKTTILQHSNIWWDQTQADILAWWHQTGQKHWQKWGVWLWILICAIILISLVSSGFIKGWNSYEPKHISSSVNSPSLIALVVIFLFGVPIVLFSSIILGIFFGRIHYYLIYKPIFRSFRIRNVILYIIVCLIIYDSFLADYVLEKFKSLKDSHEDDVFAYLIWVASLMFSIIYDFKKNEKNKQMLERERNIAEIQALKAQINPHFLFNTLNNLYGTAVLEESPKTADGIQQLARIMRHAVESSKNDRIEIDKEISFLHDYIEIQQLRIPKRDNIRIQTAIQWDEQPAQIAPLILMTFAENAFKFGISIAYECFLEIKLTVENQQLTFICRNSVLPRTSLEQGTGTGLDNTLKRLKLLYPKQHTISINQTDSVYEVFLTINLHD